MTSAAAKSIPNSVASCQGSVVMIECPDINSKGSGFFISDSGHVLTNNHVISKLALQNGIIQNTYSSQIFVHHGGQRYPATLKSDPNDARPAVYDYAILSIVCPAPTPVLASITLQTAGHGDEVVCLGFPLDFSTLIATKGIVSAFVKRTSHWNTLHTMQTILTDALVNFGNSGGPLIHVPTN